MEPSTIWTTVIFDAQGFSDDYESFIPKEIAWTSLSSETTIHSLLESPCQWNELQFPAQIVNEWQTNNKHGIKWDDSGMPGKWATQILTTFPHKIDTIYIYNRKLESILKPLENQTIIILENKIPFLDSLDSNQNLCNIHTKLNGSPNPAERPFSCALNNIMKMKNYILTCRVSKQIPTRATTVKTPRRGDSLISGVTWEYPQFTFFPRLHSFFNWPLQYMKTEEMARAGFFYTGYRDETSCFHCGLTLSLWLPGDNPHTRHLEGNPSCPFLEIIEEWREEIERNSSSLQEYPGY